mgnify:CR=1 FL=1|jgi:hypothetical protein|tara:strand:+ start:293 stop:496 length:204 start_codon:yes stop_codon:yes gene_type:complete
MWIISKIFLTLKGAIMRVAVLASVLLHNKRKEELKLKEEKSIKSKPKAKNKAKGVSKRKKSSNKSSG